MVARSPGDTVPIERDGRSTRTVYFDIYGPNVVVSNNTPKTRDFRPGYARSKIGKVGAMNWRFPTAYQHCSQQENRATARIVQGRPSGWDITDDGPWLAGHLASVYGIGIPIGFSDFTPTNAKNAAISAALNNLSSQKANIGETLATWNQLRGMFGSKSKKLAKLLHQFRNDKRIRNFKNFPPNSLSIPRNASAVYLEYVYGWKPLINDIAGTIQALREFSAGIKPVVVHGRGKSTTSTSKNLAYGSLGWRSSSYWIKSGLLQETSTTRVDIHARVKPELALFRMLNQLGLFNPISTAWDAIPYSFIVDWFLPIGKVLSAMTAPIGLDFISGTISTKIDRVSTAEWHLTAYQSKVGITVDQPANLTLTEALYRRVPISTWPRPGFFYDSDPFRGDRGFKAIALSISRLKQG